MLDKSTPTSPFPAPVPVAVEAALLESPPALSLVPLFTDPDCWTTLGSAIAVSMVPGLSLADRVEMVLITWVLPLGPTTISPDPLGAKVTIWLCGSFNATPPALRIAPDMRAAEARLLSNVSAVSVREPAARMV
jgi:hypothetical protein